METFIGLGAAETEKVKKAIKKAGITQLLSDLCDGLKTYGNTSGRLNTSYQLARVTPVQRDLTPILLNEISDISSGASQNSQEDLAGMNKPVSFSTFGTKGNLKHRIVQDCGQLMSEYAKESGSTFWKKFLGPQESGEKAVLYQRNEPKAHSFSGGQWQQIGLSRIFLKEDQNKLLVLDEPTAELDTHAEASFFKTLFGFKGKVRSQGLGLVGVIMSTTDCNYVSYPQCTTLFSTHKLAYAAQADIILFMENGKILEKGSHAELVAIEGGGYRAMWETDGAGYW